MLRDIVGCPTQEPHGNPANWPTVSATRQKIAKFDVQKRVLDAMPIRAAAYDAFFTTPKGFHVRVSPSGSKIFALRFRDALGGTGTTTGKPKYRRLIIGTYGEITLAQAADIATEMRARIRRGERPQDDKRRHRTIPSVAALVADYLAELEKSATPDHFRQVDRILCTYLLPTWGTEPITLLTPADMQGLHVSLAHAKSEANHALVGISAFFSFCIRQLHITINPAAAQFVKRYSLEKKRRSPLTDEQVTALAEAIRAAEADCVTWQVPAALRLLYLTGCRKSEILGLQWEEVQADQSRFSFLSSKGMKLGERARDQRHVGAEAFALLEEIRPLGKGSRYVLPRQDDPEKPFVNIDKPWRLIRDAAKLTGFTLHGFRHDMASVIGTRHEAGTIKSLLGHANIATSSLYVHTIDDPMKQVANEIGKSRAARLNRRPDIKLVG